MSELTIIDISFRLMTLGQLLLFLCLVSWQLLVSSKASAELVLLLVLIVCCACAVLFTGQYRPPWMMGLRPILLAFTDGLPFVFWAYGALSLTEFKRPNRFESWWCSVVIVYLIWHLYFFIILEGRGLFHDVVHGLAVLAVCHLVYLCISQWRDDLVTSRRRIRAVFLVAASIVLSMYALSEISGTIYMRSSAGSLLGAALLLVLSTSLGVFCLSELNTKFQYLQHKDKSAKAPEVKHAVSEQYQALHQTLTEFIESQGFTESRLTLTRLAERLDTQEHRLRVLINQGLGYRNFSSYLNDHRLPLGCEWLRSRPNVPITDVAYDLGYGSITSFNRAFKAAYGLAPSEYRHQNAINN